MALEPATTIKLIKGIGFDSSYTDVVLFNSASEQYNYFSGKAVKSFPSNSYTRLGRGLIKLGAKFEDVCDCSYLMFRNENHEDRWWYAFIDDIEYVNENTVEIQFSIDVMQSYMFSYTLGESFVVREHTQTDEVGDNLNPESIFYGDYVYQSLSQLDVDASKCPFGFSGTLSAEDMCLVIPYNPALLDIASLAIPDEFQWNENVYSGVYQGIRFLCIPLTDKLGADKVAENIKTIDTILGLLDVLSFSGVMGIYMMPIIFLPAKDKTGWYNVYHGWSCEPWDYIDGYKPRNNKLLTYPYMCVNVCNGRDAGVDYAFEYFINRKPSFMYEGSFGVNPSCLCYPVGYKGKSFATEEGVTLDSYPMCTWGEDGFTEWMSNHLFQTAVGIGTAVASVGASAVGAFGAAMADQAGALMAKYPTMTRRTANKRIMRGDPPELGDKLKYAVPKGIGAGVSAAAGELAEIGSVPIGASTPPTATGVNAHDLLFGNLFGKQIRIGIKMIRAEYAERIDKYFDRYGYACNEVKTPNLKSRPYWNYIQLRNVHLENIKCPMDVVEIIRAVYERGVTFWRPTAQLGVYDPDVQDNSL